VLTAQERGAAARQVRPVIGVMNPAARILALRDELDLTPAQVGQLEQLGNRFEQESRPLLEQLRSASPRAPRDTMSGAWRRGGAMTPEQRQRMEQRRSEMAAQRERLQPARQQLRASTEEVHAAVRAVLTSAQVAKLQELRAAPTHRCMVPGSGPRGMRSRKPVERGGSGRGR
jgi:hypothetical protein